MSLSPAPKLRIGFILAPRFTLCTFANFVDVLRLAADEGDRSRPILCNWRILSATMDPVRASCGTSVAPDQRLGKPRAFDYIVVVGGLIDDSATLGPEYLDFLSRAKDAGVPLVGVCTGAFILHRAGFLDGYRCCVSWFHHDDFLTQFKGLSPVSDQIFVVDRDRLTCSGGVSSAHLAAFLVDRHIGAAAARKSLSIMIIDGAKAEENPQPNLPLTFATSDPLVRKALLIMQQTIAAPLTIAAIAKRLGTPRRRLERHFHQALNATPSQVNRAIRLGHAQFLLQTSPDTITQIALATGFCDVSHLGKALKESCGRSPKDYRAGPAQGPDDETRTPYR